MIKLMHPAETKLRRLLDEPLLVPDQVRAHVSSCRRCAGRLGVVAADADRAGRMLGPDHDWAVDSTAALAAVRRRLRTAPAAARFPGSRHLLPRRLAHPGRPVAAAAAIVVLAVATGMGTAVAGVHWTQIFAPASVAPVPVSRSELLALPHLSDFGALTYSRQPKLLAEPSLAQAEAAAGVTLSLPSSLPQGVTGSPSFFLVRRWTATFTFSAIRAEAAAQADGMVLPPLPAGFDGAQLRESVGPGLLAIYGAGGGPHPLSNLPTLALMAAHPPTLDSTGVTVGELESYLLGLPFLPPGLASAIHQLGDPITTLPIPVLPELGQGQPTTVNGDKAVLLGGSSPLLAAVIWEHQGTVRAVGGLLDPATVLALARG